MNPANTLKLVVTACALAVAQQGYAAGYAEMPEPIWYFQYEGLGMMRDAFGDQSFAHAVTRTWTEEGDPPVDVSTDSDTTLLTTGDLGFSYRGGGRAVLGRRLGYWYALEGSYFGLSDWNTSETVSQTPLFEDPQGTFSEGNLLSPFTDYRLAPVVGLDFNDFITINYRSSLENLEWNFRGKFVVPSGKLQGCVLAGGRYMHMTEWFNYHSSSDQPAVGTTNDVNVRTDNRMIGVQVGTQVELEVDPQWWFGCEVKGVFFRNQANQNTVYTNNSGVAPYDGTHTGSEAGIHSAFTLDLRLSLVYQPGPNLSTHLGYNIIWMNGLALASENFNRDVNALVSGPASLVDDGKVAYHGPFLGGTLKW